MSLRELDPFRCSGTTGLTLATVTGPSDIYKIVKMIMVKNYNPVIVFAFSKRECEGLALQMSKLEFNSDEERDMVDTVFNNAISGLSEDDRQLPQIEHILPLLKRGIGIHHGGLLPILKEVIEILFQEGLLKVLFATETFSIGLNMPAKTVVFTSVRKFDGRDFRNLSGGEYIQMSGRAGRRGLDDRGIVIMMTDEKLEPAAAKGMVKGQADRLDSAFHLGYNMILNLMRVEGLTPEYMLERSFYQFQNTASVPKLEDELRQLDEQRAAIVIPDEDNIADYYDLRQQLDILNRDLRDVLNHPTYALPFLQPGRLVRVKHDDLDFGWGVVVNYQKRLGAKGKPLAADEPPQNQYIVDVLLHVAKGTAPAPASVTGKNKHASPANAMTTLRPCPPGGGDDGEFAVVPVLLSTLDGISHIRIFLAKDLKPLDARMQALKSVKEVKRRFPSGIALLDPVENMGIVDEAFKKLLRVRFSFLCVLKNDGVIEPSADSLSHAPYSAHRDPRVAPRLEPSALGPGPPLALRPVRGQGVPQAQDPRDQEKDHAGPVGHAPRRAQEPQARPAPARVRDGRGRRRAEGARRVRDLEWRRAAPHRDGLWGRLQRLDGAAVRGAAQLLRL